MAKALLKSNTAVCGDLNTEEGASLAVGCLLEPIARGIINTQNHQIQTMKGILETLGAEEFADCTISEPVDPTDAPVIQENGDAENSVDSNLDGECAAQEDNDDGWCDRYISRLPDGLKTCDCYDFCNGELIGCLAKGEEPNEYDDCAFLRLGCTADQKAPPGFSAAPSVVPNIYQAGLYLLSFMVVGFFSLP